MYPPSCAVLLAMGSIVGERQMVLALIMLNSAAWLASIVLAVYLATGKAARQNPLLYIVPMLAVVPFISDTFLLGQPNLLLLALMLGGFACLRRRWPWGAGALIGLAAAIKAFPAMALVYLVYRAPLEGDIQFRADGPWSCSLVAPSALRSEAQREPGTTSRSGRRAWS